MITTTKIFIGPMSKNIVDSIVEYCNENNVNIGLIPSRRQVEYNGGYVNNWKTKEFSDYVKLNTDKVLLVRDHGGPLQGNVEDDGFRSLKDDCKYFDVIHVDVWKKCHNLKEGALSTAEYINFCYFYNPNLIFEIATEEAICKFTPTELDNLVKELKFLLKPEIFERIKFLVVQSGTSLMGNVNTGEYNQDRLIEMVKIAKKWNLIAKEHNGDYLSDELVKSKFKNGLNCINIAPEFGKIETDIILDEMNKNHKNLINDFFNICYESKRWGKWVKSDFNPFENKEELIKICGHYVFSNSDFLKLKSQLTENVDDIIKQTIKIKLQSLLKIDK
jgi:D-tagatose-1,6-bisphosphate aldolase subunit GatZ/KbaZ